MDDKKGDDIELQPVVKRREQRFKLGIIGYGFVGQAVDYGFSTESVDKFIIDPKYNKNTIQDLCDWQPTCVFICAPTPSKKDGSIDSSIIDDAVMRLINQTDAFIVIKSTVTPDVIDRLSRIDGKVVYNPEFLQEGNAKQDFINQRFRVVGVQQPEAGRHLEGLYNYFSLCNPAQMITMSCVEAAYFKYAVNTFLAMKVTFMNQLKEVIDDYGGSYNQLSRALAAEYRLGNSHMKIPGHDGKPGFGGSCFPKDLTAWLNFVDKKTNANSDLLKSVKKVNDKIRSNYDISDREKEQNVDYGQTKKEQQTKDDGDSKSK